VSGKLNFVDVGQCFSFYSRDGMEAEISNPYKSELINFLRFEFEANFEVPDENLHSSFDLGGNRNILVKVLSSQSVLVFIGKFDGRNEGTYKLNSPSNQVFVFIVEGAFEVQNRLLHARDGLALQGMAEVEFEALSNEAILLIVESLP
jgi:quercetin 2,3-dioxygenase